MNSNRINWDNWEVTDLLPTNERGTCRICKHEEYWHKNNYPSCTYSFRNEVKACIVGSIEILTPRKNKIPVCFCLEYVPGNNLAYLEWCHDRRRV